MVRVTTALCKYIPEWYNLGTKSSSFFKKQAMIYMCRYHKKLSWSQGKNAVNRFEYYLKGEQFFAEQVRQRKRDINRSRIDAACAEHGYHYANFMSTLPKIDIHINLASLSRLAIYEPQTFKALVDICKEVTSEEMPPANFNPRRLDSTTDVPREFVPSSESSA